MTTINGGSNGSKDNSGDSDGNDDDDDNDDNNNNNNKDDNDDDDNDNDDNDDNDNNNDNEMPLPPRLFTIRLLCANQAADMLLHISTTLQIITRVLTGRVAGLSSTSNMDIGSSPTARYSSCCQCVADMSARDMM
jgi:hypothetical protein